MASLPSLICLKLPSQYLSGKGGARYEDTISGVDMYLIPDKEEITSYKLRLSIFNRNIPVWLIDKNFEVHSVRKGDIKKISTFLFKNKRAAFFFIWHGQQERMAYILENLRQQGFPYGYLVLSKGNDEVIISIRGSDYGVQNILRSY